MHTFYDRLIEMVEKERVLQKEPMSRHTTFRVGGAADYFVSVKTEEEIWKVLALCKEEGIPFFVLGNGSNLLVGDGGYRGVIVQICKEMNAITVEGDRLRVQAGALLSKIGNVALDAGLTGFEFGAGIPGTLGGAVYMNAGAYGGEMKDVIESATVLNPQGERMVLSKEELELGYRTSKVAKEGYVVLEAVLKLQPGDPEEIREKMAQLREQRVTKQPLEFPSAGSTFKRPTGYFAGKLIQDAGLAGLTVGGAQVSEKHCGFVINRGGATAAEIMELVRQVQQKVKETFGVELELEVRRLGEF